MFVVTLLTVVGCGLVGGTFFAFSTFIMRAFARLPAAQAVAAMQAINVTVVSPPFMIALFGTGAASLVLAVWSVGRLPATGAVVGLTGGLLYFVGNVVVTIAFNVPRNNRLASLRAESDEAAAYWPQYLRVWTAWNHVRTVTALVAAVLLAHLL